MNDQLQLPSDRALVEQARAGSEAAWTALRSRHVDAVEALARSRARRQSKRSVDAVFDQLRDDTAADGTRSDDGRSAPIRPRAIGVLTGGSYGPVRSTPCVGPHPVAQPSGRAARTHRQDLVDLAVAFGRLPTLWQAVLWHRWVERAPAAELTAILGRCAADVVALEQTAQRGLVDGYAEVVLSGAPPPDAACIPVIPVLGARRRGTLPDVQGRVVDEHLASCSACRRHIDLLDRVADVMPVAIVPGLTGVDVDRYQGLIGAGVAMGAAALSRRRSERGRRLARVGAGLAVVLAFLAAAFFVREPLGELDSGFADLLERVTSTTDPTVGTLPGGSDATPDPLPNRIELVFPGAPQGALSVLGAPALDLELSLSVPAPVYAGATGTIEVAITNDDTEDASIRFLVRSSPGVSFDRLAQGPGSCVAEQDAGAQCTLSLPSGSMGEMSLRFDLAAEVPDRLVVVASIRSGFLELPVESTAVAVSAGNVASPSGDLATGTGLGASEAHDPSGFRSVADVTDLVRAAGGGDHTVVRGPSTDDPGDGSWTLTVITDQATAPRRLFVVIRPQRVVELDAALRVTVPIGGSPPTDSAQRPVTLILQAATRGSGTSTVAVDRVGSVTVTGGTVVEDTVAYDLEIASTEDVLTLEASTLADTLRLASIGPAADIVP